MPMHVGLSLSLAGLAAALLAFARTRDSDRLPIRETVVRAVRAWDRNQFGYLILVFIAGAPGIGLVITNPGTWKLRAQPSVWELLSYVALAVGALLLPGFFARSALRTTNRLERKQPPVDAIVLEGLRTTRPSLSLLPAFLGISVAVGSLTAGGILIMALFGPSLVFSSLWSVALGVVFLAPSLLLLSICYVVVPAMVLEGLDVQRAFQRSAQLTRGERPTIAVLQLLFLLCFLGAFFINNRPSSPPSTAVLFVFAIPLVVLQSLTMTTVYAHLVGTPMGQDVDELVETFR